MWNASSSTVNTVGLKVLIIQLSQCNVLVLSDSVCPQLAIEMILLSKEVHLESDSNDSRIICISCITKQLFKIFLGQSQHEQSIVVQITAICSGLVDWQRR